MVVSVVVQVFAYLNYSNFGFNRQQGDSICLSCYNCFVLARPLRAGKSRTPGEVVLGRTAGFPPRKRRRKLSLVNLDPISNRANVTMPRGKGKKGNGTVTKKRCHAISENSSMTNVSPLNPAAATAHGSSIQDGINTPPGFDARTVRDMSRGL